MTEHDPCPLVTVGIPFHNAADTLLDAVRSIFAQTYTNWELILACDGSTDGSDRLARRIRHPRVRVVGDGTRRYLACRLNQITREAKGELIARMDADDLVAPERIERQVKFLREHPEVDGCGTGTLTLDGDLNLVGRQYAVATHEEITARPLHGIRITHASFVGRADWFRKFPYEEHNAHAQDWNIWLRSFQQSRFANLLEPLYFYRCMVKLHLPSYIRAKSLVAKTILFANPHVGPLWQRLLHAARQYAQMAAYVALQPIKPRRFSGRRGKPCAPGDAKYYQECLRRIRACPVELADEGR